MAKKYVPSGYLIVNLGHFQSLPVNISKGTNADADILMDNYDKLDKKPILLSVNDVMGFATYDYDADTLILTSTNAKVVINLGDSDITINVTGA